MRDARPAREWFIAGAALGTGAAPRIDFQMHTRWTDGRSSVDEMITVATEKRLHAIAITEHVNETSGWYPDFVAEVRACRERQSDVAVYFGAEIAAADYRGGLKADPAGLDAELILGVVHRLPKQDGSGFWGFEELTAEDGVDLEIQALTGLAANPMVDVLGHPGGTAFKKFGPFPVEWMQPAFVAARDHDVAVELNIKYLWDLPGMIALLREINPLVSFGSDAHEATHVGNNFAALQEHPAILQTPALSS